MKNLGKLIGILLVGVVFVLYYFHSGLRARKITIFFTNDIHGHILPSKGTGGYAVLSNFLKTQKKPYLLLDAGDIFQGTPEGDLTNGEASVKIMNKLEYDGMTLGNHEFDKGRQQLKKLIKMADFPVLGANIIDKKTGKIVRWAEPYFIKEISGIKIGILGLITSAMPYITMPEVRRGIEFQREVNVAKEYIPELRKNCDIVIALTHIGLARKGKEFEDDIFLAKNTEGIDIILGGHTHNFLEKPVVVNKTAIVQAGSYGRCVGEIVLKVRRKNIVDIKYRLISLSIKKYGEDKEMKEFIAELTKDISEKMAEAIGSSAQKLPHSLYGKLSRNRELPLGNWQTDVFRIATNSDIAFQNLYGIRADLPSGKITLRHIYELSPFGNTIYTMKLTGAQIKEILEKSVSGRFGMLQLSGLKFKYDMNKKEGERVVEITVGGKPVNSKKYYKIATNSFVAKGGDGFDTFKRGRDIRNTGIIDRELQVEWFKKHSPVTAKVEGRIINITE